uniref:Uncharacterized protein n=1 Tax=Populus alba TaxID=43335 RepID=A0A4U5R4X8_POPAL|nr:hypothetical protein D5086_0000007010 [Populus alba]
MGGLDGTSSSWINQNEPNWPQTPSRHHNSFIHQPQPGHGYMTPNATTSQHGGFNQPGPSFPPPWIQTFSNEGQVHQVAVIPNIDNMQQENFVLGSQMDTLQVRGLQNQTAMPNASNPGLGTSLRRQNRGGIGRVQRELQVVEPEVGEERISSHAIAGNKEVSMNGMRAQEDRVSEGALESRLRTEPVDRALEESNPVLGNLAGAAGRIQVGVQGMEQGPGEERIQSQEPGVGEERISSHAIAGNDVDVLLECRRSIQSGTEFLTCKYNRSSRVLLLTLVGLLWLCSGLCCSCMACFYFNDVVLVDSSFAIGI